MRSTLRATSPASMASMTRSREAVGDAVEVVDVYDEAAATMPK